MSAQNPVKRNRLTPWYIGLVVIAVSILFVAWRMWKTDCGIPMSLEIGVLFIMPAVYLVLMYLTLTSQE